MKTASAMLASTLLIGGAVAAQPLRAVPYKAAGTEPFWALTIDKAAIRFEDAERNQVVAQAPMPRPSFNGVRYVTPRMTVDVTRARCSDGMSDRIYPDSVIVTLGRRALRGCGGEPVVAPAPAPAPLIEGRWRIERINGRPVIGGREAFLSFTGGRIAGNAGCNSFGGSFRFARGFLTAGPLIATRMACPGEAMARENAVLSTLRERLSVTTNPAGKLVLTARSSARLTLAR